MFEHSVRVPRSYKLAATILKRVKEDNENFKTILYQQKYTHFNVKAIHALICETLRHENELNNLIVKSKLLLKETRFDPWLARILITELIWGKRALSGNSIPELTIKQYQKDLEKISEEANSTKSVGSDPVKEFPQPRYIRINTLRTSTADAVGHFQDEGCHLVRCTSKSYDEYLNQLGKLAEDEFISDFHVKVVFAFGPNAKFYNDQMYLNSEIFLQNKATCLAPFLLAPTPGSTILDMCAAPGMKTSHLAAIIKNEGTIYSIEQNLERYKMLCEFVEASGATCVKPINGDASEINKIACPNVDYILLDPSCSGSGISRPEANDEIFDKESGRVHKLASFQAKLLRHALNEFTTAKRVVYSTCSLYSEENEAVVEDVVKNHKGHFRLVNAKEKLNGNWNNVGDSKFINIGEHCLYARPSSDYATGFFIAIFENLLPQVANSNTKINSASNTKRVQNGFTDINLAKNQGLETLTEVKINKVKNKYSAENDSDVSEKNELINNDVLKESQVSNLENIAENRRKDKKNVKNGEIINNRDLILTAENPMKIDVHEEVLAVVESEKRKIKKKKKHAKEEGEVKELLVQSVDLCEMVKIVHNPIKVDVVEDILFLESEEKKLKKKKKSSKEKGDVEEVFVPPVALIKKVDTVNTLMKTNVNEETLSIESHKKKFKKKKKLIKENDSLVPPVDIMKKLDTIDNSIKTKVIDDAESEGRKSKREKKRCKEKSEAAEFLVPPVDLIKPKTKKSKKSKCEKSLFNNDISAIECSQPSSIDENQEIISKERKRKSIENDINADTLLEVEGESTNTSAVQSKKKISKKKKLENKASDDVLALEIVSSVSEDPAVMKHDKKKRKLMVSDDNQRAGLQVKNNAKTCEEGPVKKKKIDSKIIDLCDDFDDPGGKKKNKKKMKEKQIDVSPDPEEKRKDKKDVVDVESHDEKKEKKKLKINETKPETTIVLTFSDENVEASKKKKKKKDKEMKK